MAELEVVCEVCGVEDTTARMSIFRQTGKTTVTVPDPAPFRPVMLCPFCRESLIAMVRERREANAARRLSGTDQPDGKEIIVGLPAQPAPGGGDAN